MFFLNRLTVLLVFELLFIWSAAFIEVQQRFSDNGILSENSSIVRIENFISSDACNYSAEQIANAHFTPSAALEMIPPAYPLPSPAK